MPNKPNFFIIGAAKAGTTSLYKYLDQHPGIFFSPIKEPNFFSTDILIENFKADYRKHTEIVGDKYFANIPLKELHLSFVRNEKHYFQLFDKAKEETAIGECSTSYLFSDVAAEKIKVFNSESKIIAILRNPIERAYSHYLMGLRFGYTTKSFREAVEEDINQQVKAWGISKLYIELGLYSEQLARYYNTFNTGQIKVYLIEDLHKNPQAVMKDICQFLEIEYNEVSQTEKHNAAQIPKNKILNKFIYQSGIRNLFSPFLPSSFKSRIRQIYFSEEEVQEISEADKKFLLDIYKDDILATSKLINRNLENWLD